MTATTKLELSNVSYTVRIARLDADDQGRIPDKLAEATLTILKVHQANGDLAWVGDTVRDMELGAGPTIDAPALEDSPLERQAVRLFRDYFESMAEQYGTQAAWEAVQRLSQICTDPDNITP